MASRLMVESLADDHDPPAHPTLARQGTYGGSYVPLYLLVRCVCSAWYRERPCGKALHSRLKTVYHTGSESAMLM